MSGQANNRRPSDVQRRRQERARQTQQQPQRQQQQRLQQSAPAAQSGHMATQEEYKYLLSLRDGYKTAALGLKLTGNREKALSMLKISKQLAVMTQAIEEGKPVDLTGLPPRPPKISVPAPQRARMAPPPPPARTQTDVAPARRRNNLDIEKQMERASLNSLPVTPSTSTQNIEQVAQAVRTVRVTQDEDVARLFDAPTSASSVMEALEQRLEKYKSTMDSATAEGNASKARRLGRIVKQYENAIKAATKGLDFDFDSLPCPPGYPPIPWQGNKVVIKVEYDPSRQQSIAQEPPRSPREKPVRPKTELNAKVDELTDQQNMLKRAAVAAKDSDDRAQALKLLRLAKGLDPIIEAVKCGLPFDEASIPPELNETLKMLKN